MRIQYAATILALALIALLAFGAVKCAYADTVCDIAYRHIQVEKRNIDALLYEISLVRLDLLAYTPDQVGSLEYLDKMATYETYQENYNAIVANHNQLIKTYQERCE